MYPALSYARVNDSQAGLAVLFDNSHAVGSFAPGSLDLVIHRWWNDDAVNLPPNHHGACPALELT